MGYWSDYHIDQCSNQDTVIASHTCTCGCKFKAYITKNPGFNDSETYCCPECGQNYSAHCSSVYVKKD